MQFKLLQLMIATAVVGVVAWLAIPRVVIVSDGHFELGLQFPAEEKLDTTLMVAYCWNEIEANHANEHGSSTSEIIFRPIEVDPNGKSHVTLPCSGKYTQSNDEISYNEPKFVVIQFNDNDTICRRKFSVPAGKGDRTLSIDLD